MKEYIDSQLAKYNDLLIEVDMWNEEVQRVLYNLADDEVFKNLTHDISHSI